MGSLAHRVQQRAELEAKKQDVGTQTADLEENANQSLVVKRFSDMLLEIALSMCNIECTD